MLLREKSSRFSTGRPSTQARTITTGHPSYFETTTITRYSFFNWTHDSTYTRWSRSLGSMVRKEVSCIHHRASPSLILFSIRHYSLEVVQQPLRARMCGFGDKVRFMLHFSSFYISFFIRIVGHWLQQLWLKWSSVEMTILLWT